MSDPHAEWTRQRQRDALIEQQQAEIERLREGNERQHKRYGAEIERLTEALQRKAALRMTNNQDNWMSRALKLEAALRDSMCPGGGYTGQPKDESPTVGNCLKAGVCGCDTGAALEGK